jgi:phosphate-selective porin
VNGLYSDVGAGTQIAQIGNPIVNTDGSMGTLSVLNPTRERSWGVDQTLTVGPFAVTAEYLENSLESQNGQNIFNGTSLTGPAFPGGVNIPGRKSVVMNGFYVQPSYYIWGKKLQLVAKWESFNPGQVQYDNISTATAGINWYIHQQNVVAMLDYMHTWSEFRSNYAGYGPSDFNEVMLRLELFF